MPSELQFTTPADFADDAELVLVVGSKSRLAAADVLPHLPAGAAGAWPGMVARLEPRHAGDVTTTWIAADPPLRLSAAAVSEQCSRHGSPARPDVIAESLAKWAARTRRLAILAVLERADHAYPVGCAIARAFPEYSAKGARDGAPPDDGDRRVRIAFLAPDGAVPASPRLAAAVEGIRLAARLTDTPTSELDSDGFVAEARRVAEACGARIEVIAGEELRSRGLGGIWSVGRAAARPPALVVLSHEPAGAARTLCWIGKGIVYDTGGLSLKGREIMIGMKRDMGGAAAVLAGFQAMVRIHAEERIHALLCVAENAVGPGALRPDDIVTLYSGRTVEVNNTDAEGRLVLADGVAWAVRHLAPDVLVDLATLTGAQMVATGKHHAAVVASDPELEQAAIAAGRRSGDLVHPLPYCPEFFAPEFESKLADLKNSVEDRKNAQTSCAAQFIAESLGSYTGPWLHIDMAGPCQIGERASGYGVALLLELFAPAPVAG